MLGLVKSLCEVTEGLYAGQGHDGKWALESLALAWKTQREDMVQDVEDWKETNGFGGQRGMRTMSGSLAYRGWAVRSLVGGRCVLSPTDTSYLNIVSYI